jgi:hypothetical protein
MREQDDNLGRRDFFRKLAAGVALSALGALTAFLAGKRGAQATSAGQTCGNRGLCRGCPMFDACGLPQALSAKQVLGRR